MIYQNHTALLIDAENTPIGKLTTFLEKWRPFDREITLKRAYGNWSNPCLKNWKNLLRTHAVRPVQLFDCATGKNAADIALAVDAMELLHTGQYDTFVIMSSDSDYTPLAMKLREAGVHVLGIGKDDASNAYRNACTNYVCFHNIYCEEPDSLQALLNECGFCDEEDVPAERCDLIEDDFLDTSFLFDEEETPDEVNLIEEEDPFKDLELLTDTESNQSNAPLPMTLDGIWDGRLKEDDDEEDSIVLDDIWDTLDDSDDVLEDATDKPAEEIVWDSLDDLLKELDLSEAEAVTEIETTAEEEIVWDTLNAPANEDTDPDWPNNVIWETISTVDENGDIIWDTLDDSFPDVSGQAKAAKMRSVHKLLHVAYDYCKDDNGVALLSSIGNFIKELRPEFDCRNYGFKQLHQLLQAYPDQYQVITCPAKVKGTVLALRCCA